MLFTSGEWYVDPEKEITYPLVTWMAKQFVSLSDVTIEINQVDLAGEFAYGFCQVDEDNEFLIHIHNRLNIEEYVTTLIHELIHVKQTLEGMLGHDERESEAYSKELPLSNQFWDSRQTVHWSPISP